jgi:hypothetical protein
MVGDLLSPVPRQGHFCLKNSSGGIIVMSVGAKGEGTVAGYIIALLSELYDTSSLTPEILRNHVDIVSWDGDDIVARFKD